MKNSFSSILREMLLPVMEQQGFVIADSSEDGVLKRKNYMAIKSS